LANPAKKLAGVIIPTDIKKIAAEPNRMLGFHLSIINKTTRTMKVENRINFSNY
jgi:hypothetical protein